MIAFVECLSVPSGVGAGGRLRLRPWQKRFIREVYGPEVWRKGRYRRRVRRAVLSMARKNGKTTLLAALALAHLVGPEAIVNGEIYSAANDREQAGQAFKVAAQMARADPELSRLLKVVDSVKTIACRHNGSFYRAVSAEAGTKHGLNPSVVIYDELAQSKSRALFDALDTAMGGREEPLFVAISTQSNDPLHILSQVIDDGLSGLDPETVTHLYTVPQDVGEGAFTDRAVWKLANPALGDFRSLADFRAQAGRAQRMPSFEAPFRNLYLNQRVDAASPVIARSDWLARRRDGPLLVPGEEVYLGIDLSGSTDLTALVAVSARDGERTAAWFWKPREPMGEHQMRDRVPYDVWARDGHIETTAGRTVDYAAVARRLGRLLGDYEVKGCAFDRWRIDVLSRDLARHDILAWVDGRDRALEGALRLVPWGQGFKDMSPAIEAVETSILSGAFAHDGNPVLTWCVSNAVAETDAAGNRKLNKLKSRFRIDGMQALAMALGVKARDRAHPGGAAIAYHKGGIFE